MIDVIGVGAGGHAKVVIEALQLAGTYRVVLTDDGIGAASAIGTADGGLGSRIIGVLSRQLGAEIVYPESDTGMRAEVTPELTKKRKYIAQVTIVDKVVDAASGTFGVRLELPNTDLAIPSGIKCQVTFEGA